jgi:pyridinium-3,5-biscarboxylic acid mononucleotide synthase
MKTIDDLLRDVKEGRISVGQARKLIKLDAVAVVGSLARIDYNRYLRRGVPEIVYAQSKSEEQLEAIVKALARKKIQAKAADVPAILSRVSPLQVQIVRRSISSSSEFKKKLAVNFLPDARLLVLLPKNLAKKYGRKTNQKNKGRVGLIAAGTSDIPALNESEAILNIFGCRTFRINDAGVAALHRLSGPLKELFEFDPDAIIVAAGMEGALPSLIAGLSDVPVVGLPTSVGYGYGGKGEGALMNMLQACSLGVSVVNIDSGVAAGVVAWLIARRASQRT